MKPLFLQLKTYGIQYYRAIQEETRHTCHFYRLFAIGQGLINTLYFIIWLAETRWWVSPFLLWLGSSLLCLGLFFYPRWPELCRQHARGYWLLTVSYCLPFYFLSLFLMTHAHLLWAYGGIAAFAWLLLLVDFTTLSFVVISSMLAALLVTLLVTGVSHTALINGVGINTADERIIGALLTAVLLLGYGACLLVVRCRRRKMRRVESMANMNELMIHSLKTRVSAVHLGLTAIPAILPDLVEAYRVAQAHHLKIPFISPDQLPLLFDVAKQARLSVAQIDALLNLFRMKGLYQAPMARLRAHSLKTLLLDVIEQYPFNNDTQRTYLHLDARQVEDALILVDQPLFSAILLKILRSAFFHVFDKQKGTVIITTTVWQDQDMAEIVIRQTARGFSARMIQHAFEPFEETVSGHGGLLGLELFLSQHGMHTMGGQIRCTSNEAQAITDIHLCFKKQPMPSHSAK